MTTLETVRQVYVAQPFDSVRFALSIHAYLADTTRRRRDQLLIWSRQDTLVAQAEPADAGQLCMRLFKPELDRAFVTAFVPLDLANAGVVDPADELAHVQRELAGARETASSAAARAHRLERELAEARRQADLLARQLRDQDGGELQLRNTISELEDDLVGCRDKLSKQGGELRDLVRALQLTRKMNLEAGKLRDHLTFEVGHLREQVETIDRARHRALSERARLLDQLAAVQPQLDRLAEIDKNNSTHYEADRPIEPYSTPLPAPAPAAILRPLARQETVAPAPSRFDISDSLLELD